MTFERAMSWEPECKVTIDVVLIAVAKVEGAHETLLC